MAHAYITRLSMPLNSLTSIMFSREQNYYDQLSIGDHADIKKPLHLSPSKPAAKGELAAE